MIEINKVGMWIFARWRLIVASLVVCILAGCLLLLHLGTLNNGASAAELTYVRSISSGKALMSDPTFLVHKLPIYLLFKLGFKSIAAYRLVSVMCAATAVLSCFIILKRAYTTRVAILTACLLLTSAWVLHVGRSATPESSFLLILPLVLLATWLHATDRHYPALLVLCFVLALSFYIPGFMWLACAAVIWERKAIMAAFRAVTLWFKLMCGGVITLGLLPLAWAAAHNFHSLIAATGLPSPLAGVRLALKNLSTVVINLIAFGPMDPARWLGRLPILDVFSIVMLVLGIYSMRYHFKRHDIQILAGSVVFSVVLISLGGAVTISALIPLLYIFVGAGMAFMLQQWVTVFPRNPIARTTATTLMSITVILVAYYHVSHYFIAWPQTPATKRAFGYSLLK